MPRGIAALGCSDADVAVDPVGHQGVLDHHHRGLLDWTGIVSALEAAGYHGPPLVIESFTADNAFLRDLG